MIAESPIEQHWFGLVEDHLELAKLEFRYEAAADKRRLRAVAGSWASGFLALLSIQAALMAALWRVGVALYWSGAGFGLMWSLVTIGVYRYGGIRDPKVGAPFEGTRAELRKSWKWIRQNIS